MGAIGLLLLALGVVLLVIRENLTNAVDFHTLGWVLVIVGAVGVLAEIAMQAAGTGPRMFHRRVSGPGGVVHEDIDER